VPRTESTHAAAAPPSAALTRIEDHSGICMLSNRYLGQRPDVPIEVEGKTYHGCCANCAARLGAMAEARMAKDPITGHAVDKATAVLARDASNRVYYFESEATFAQASK
jgi:YHS domain-containing protein